MSDKSEVGGDVSGLRLVMSGLGVSREDLTRFVEWQARFKIDPDDPLYGVALAVRATLQNALTASNAAVEAAAISETLPERLRNAEDELAGAILKASNEAKGTIDKSAQQTGRKISIEVTKSVASQVAHLIRAANGLEAQATRYRHRVLEDTTAAFVNEVKRAAIQELHAMTWRSRVFVALATLGLLLSAAVGGILLADLDGHVIPYRVERLGDGKPDCRAVDIAGVGKKYACMVHTARFGSSWF